MVRRMRGLFLSTVLFIGCVVPAGPISDHLQTDLLTPLLRSDLALLLMPLDRTCQAARCPQYMVLIPIQEPASALINMNHPQCVLFQRAVRNPWPSIAPSMDKRFGHGHSTRTETTSVHKRSPNADARKRSRNACALKQSGCLHARVRRKNPIPMGIRTRRAHATKAAPPIPSTTASAAEVLSLPIPT